MKTAFTFLVCIFLIGCSQPNEPNYAEYWKSWGDEQLTSWVSHTNSFASIANSFCEGEAGLNEAQVNWKELDLLWAKMNGLPYHAITNFNLSFELYAWPDKRNMTAARLNTRIEQGEMKPEDLEAATAFEKGLIAMEWLLFEEALSQEERCHVLPIVSDYYQLSIQKISEYHQEMPLVLAEWTLGKGNPEAHSISMNLLFQQIGKISNRLRNSLDAEGKFIPILTEGWRAGISTELFITSLQSLHSHLEALSDRTDLTVNSQGLLEDHRAQLNNILSELNQMSQDTYDWLQLQVFLADLEGLIEGPIAQELGVLIGFNNYDGD